MVQGRSELMIMVCAIMSHAVAGSAASSSLALRCSAHADQTLSLIFPTLRLRGGGPSAWMQRLRDKIRPKEVDGDKKTTKKKLKGIDRSMSMELLNHMEQHTIVDATPEECYATAVGFEEYPKWAGSMRKVTVLKRDHAG